MSVQVVFDCWLRSKTPRKKWGMCLVDSAAHPDLNKQLEFGVRGRPRLRVTKSPRLLMRRIDGWISKVRRVAKSWHVGFAERVDVHHTVEGVVWVKPTLTTPSRYRGCSLKRARTIP